MSDQQSIRNELVRLERAIGDVEAAMERLQTSQPVSDEGREDTRAALRGAQARVAILRAQAAHGEGAAEKLASALDKLEALETSLADDEEIEAHYERLCALHEELQRQYDDAIARLGVATYASLRADLARLTERVEQAEAQAESARLAERDARESIAQRLHAWPALAAEARAKYADDARKPGHEERVLSALLALWDAMEDGRGQVGTVVNGSNIIQYFYLTPEGADAVLHRGTGRIVDDRIRNQVVGIIEALRKRR